MATEWEDFKFWYAKSLTENSANDAELFLTNANGVSLVYVRMGPFLKRVTDTSNIQAQDKKAPDSGNALAQVEIQIAFNRETAQTEPTPTEILTKMFFLAGNDPDFREGRFGLENKDNPELDMVPIASAGYRLMSAEQDPNKSTPAIQIFTIQIQILGDHTKLGAYS